MLYYLIDRTDYVTWNGPDPDLRHGPSKTSARGANGDLLKDKTGHARGPGLARGPNPELRKGSQNSPKGSIYQQIKPAESAANGTRGR
jgi:hypothetical protein